MLTDLWRNSRSWRAAEDLMMRMLWVGSNRIWFPLLLVGVVALVLGLVLPQGHESSSAETMPSGSQLHTQGLASLPTGGPIRLPLGSHREPFDLEALSGQYVWLYFGFTSCADACPMSLGWISVALNQVPSELADRVGAVFISLDPERDTVEHLRDYVAHFHPRIEAATGSIEQLQAVAADYGVYFAPAEIDSALGYVLDHSSVVFLLGPEGQLLETHPHGTPPQELVFALERHILQPVPDSRSPESRSPSLPVGRE
jgi:protein SCO1/2